MAYTVHGFQSGETLYAEQLNEMDEQIAENERTAASAQSTAEAARTAANNQWSGDGVHPTQAGYEKDGLFTAARLKGYFI